MSDVLALVLAGHFIGDWIVQTDWQAAHKVWRESVPPLSTAELGSSATQRTFTPAEIHRVAYRRSWWANQEHMAGYHMTMCAALLPVGRAITGWQLFWLIAVSWVTHSFIDRRWPVRWLMAHTGSKPFSETTFGVIAVDQALHLSILCGLVAAIR